VPPTSASILKPPRPQALRRNSWSPARTWGLIGFASGIIFWHLIGFWSFVVDTIYPMAAPSSASTPSASARSSATPHSLAIRATKARNGKVAPAASPTDAWTATVVDAPADD
jgi:hypothetical protein